MVVSVLMLLSFAFLVFCLLRITVSFTKLVWFPVTLLVAISIPLCFYGLASLVGVRFSPFLILIVNCLAALLAWLYCGKSKRESSHVQMGSREDVIAVVVLTILSASLFIAQFGWPVLINFETTDPAVHLNHSLYLYEDGTVTGQYSTHMICACFIAILSPFLGPDSALLAFSLSETFLLLLSGLMFYSTIAIYCPKLGWIARIVLCVFYLLGYPLNNSIFGFSYWGFSVTIICALLFMAKALPPKDVISMALFAILLFDLIISYSLFVPVVYLAVFVWMLVCFRREKATFVLKALSIVFIFPVVAGFIIVYLGIFGESESSGVSVGSAINTVGYSFRNLFSVFLPIAPLSIYGAVVNKTRNSFLVMFSALFLMFSMAMFILGMLNYVSAYYFSKLYSVLWLIFFIFGAMGIQALKEKNIAMLASYCAVWFLVLLLAVSGMDGKIYNSRRDFSAAPIAWSLFPIYEFNLAKLSYGQADSDLNDLLQEAKAYGDADEDYEVLGSDYLIRWSTPILGNTDPLLWWMCSERDVLDNLLQFDYLVVGDSASESLLTIDGTTYEDLKSTLLDYYDPVYANESGGIYKKR